MIKVFAFDLDGTLTQHKTPLDFLQYFGIMCVTTRKERGNNRLKALLSSKINIAQMQDILSPQSPENRG